MKKRNIVIVCLFVLGLAVGVATAQISDSAKIDLTGTWNLSVTTPRGTGTPTFVLKQNGNKLTGTYSGYFGEAPVTGTVKGSEFEMKYTMQGTLTVYSGKTNGTRMSGTIDFGGYESGTFTGSKS